MKYTSFEINGFKGISDAKIVLNQAPAGNLFPIVGLNESGKTTLMQAINYFTYKSSDLDALNVDGFAIDDPRTLIPVSKRMNFNGNISLSVTAELDALSEQHIKSRISEELNFKLMRDLGSILVKQEFLFQDSKFIKQAHRWRIHLYGKGVQKGSKPRVLEANGKDRPLWIKCIQIISKCFPPILYFPNFLFDFPERIFLEKEKLKENTEINQFYFNVVQDILDSLNVGCDVSRHITERLKSNEQNEINALKALLMEMGRHVTQSVFGAWSNIFKVPIPNKRIVLDTGYDNKLGYYVQFRIEDDAEGSFLVSERSLGFRWFFVFLLLTHYRNSRKGSRGQTLFLFDEPASNLHPTAQEHLLDTFKSMAKSSLVLYSTHSHHMVAPDLLEKVIVVKNHGVQNIADPLKNRSATDIRIYKYREFASKYTDQLGYFKPLLDVLDYVPSKLEVKPRTVILEGKNDFYFFKLLKDMAICESSHNLNFLPGVGSGALKLPLQLFLSWSYPCLVLLDDDAAGRKERSGLLELFGPIIEEKVFTYAALNGKYSEMGLEKIIGDDLMMRVIKTDYPDATEFEKKIFWHCIQSLCLSGRALPFTDEEKLKFSHIVQWLNEKIK